MRRQTTMHNKDVSGIVLEKTCNETGSSNYMADEIPEPSFIEIQTQKRIAARRAKRELFFAILVMGSFQLFSAIATMFRMFDQQINFLVIGVVIFAFSLGLVLSMTFLINECIKASKREREAIICIKEHKGLIV